MACNDEVVMVLETKRNPAIWKNFDLCLMSDSHEMARCKGCGKFMKAPANSNSQKSVPTVRFVLNVDYDR
ncbi:hypothetical protein HanIR_Chr17g0854181 [Helianthus annuus]|nr:hypothetical protein HanIR_Chr17g0854181 [Helianthus annuus]